MAFIGHIVSISVATGASTTYSTVGGLMSMKFPQNRDLLDITDLADNNIRRRMAGLSEYKMTFDGRLEKDTGYLMLCSAYRNEAPVYVQVLYNGVTGFMAPFYVKSKKETGVIDDGVKISVELESTGEFDVVYI